VIVLINRRRGRTARRRFSPLLLRDQLAPSKRHGHPPFDHLEFLFGAPPLAFSDFLFGGATDLAKRSSSSRPLSPWRERPVCLMNVVLHDNPFTPSCILNLSNRLFTLACSSPVISRTVCPPVRKRSRGLGRSVISLKWLAFRLFFWPAGSFPPRVLCERMTWGIEFISRQGPFFQRWSAPSGPRSGHG